MKEPYFMQQLHKQRARESKILWSKFKGNFWKFHQWRMKQTEKKLLKDGLIYQFNSKTGIGYLRDVPKDKYKSKNF